MALAPGSRLGPYEVVSLVGAGGMGEVYRARDSRLKRDIAIKVLPEAVGTDPKRRARFEREAQSIAGLNHPNIVTIHSVEEAGNVLFLTMEYVDGKPLNDLIVKDGLPLTQILDLAIPLADAISAAHEKGITHRDLKPANVMVTKDGRVKVLDFGLARLIDAPPVDDGVTSSPTLTLTDEGRVLGTVAYMSPEQVRGETLDRRSDIFSFGLVLYELATGRPAFTGDTSGVVFEAILNRTPVPPARLNPELPLELDRIIKKALEKDLDLRYQSAADLRGDLKRLKRDTDSARFTTIGGTEFAQPLPTEPTRPGATVASRVTGTTLHERRPWRLVLLASICVVMFAAVAGWVVYRNRVKPVAHNAPASGTLTRISRWNKPMLNARLSPDGHVVAFSSPSDGIFQVFLILTAGGDPLQLTRDEGDKLVDSFSTDGTEIFYRRSLGHNEEWTIPTLGGAPRRAASGWGFVPASDGSAVFFLKSDMPTVFRLGKSGTVEEEAFRFAENLHLSGVLPFPNNADLLVLRTDGSDERLYKVNLPGRSSTDLGVVGVLPDLVGGLPAWLDPGKSVVLSRTVNGLTNLWKYNLNDRSFTQTTTGPGPDSSPMPDPNGRGIYYVSGKASSMLTTYQVKGGRSLDLIADDVSQPILSPDANRVMYVRYLDSDHSELWVSNVDGSNRLKLASGANLLSTLDWSPDGSHIAFANLAHLYVVETGGRLGLHEIKGTEGIIGWAAWSADSTRLFITIRDAIWTATVDGSQVQKLSDRAFLASAVSPEDRYILGARGSGNAAGIYQMRVSDKRVMPLLQGVETYTVRFAPDYTSFVYIVAGRAETTLYRQGWREGALVGTPKVALKLPFAFPLAYKGNAFDFSRDLSRVVYVRPGGQHDLYFLSKAQQ